MRWLGGSLLIVTQLVALPSFVPIGFETKGGAPGEARSADGVSPLPGEARKDAGARPEDLKDRPQAKSSPRGSGRSRVEKETQDPSMKRTEDKGKKHGVMFM